VEALTMLERGTVSGLLTGCAAIVVAHDDGDCTALRSLAQRVGFGLVTSLSQSGDLAQRLPFFLVHYGMAVATKKHVLAQLRGASDDNVRFAPIVLFVPDGPSDEMLFYIEMGFDDVICLPDKSHILEARLAAQIGQERRFIETKTYLGPDRRRMETDRHGRARRSVDYEHTRLTIIRQPGVGVRIVHRELFLKTL
jgi:hypothetical protein